ncbi:MAG: hypothetical protein FJ291_23140 [Planctomycetes bacterium]|nr:hypothetical protein [Planctomycetota bacterium]
MRGHKLRVLSACLLAMGMRAAAVSPASKQARMDLPADCTLRMAVEVEKGADPVVAHVYFLGRHVFEFEGDADGELVAVYDLDKEMWHEVRKGEAVDMAEVREWLKQSEERTAKSAANPRVSADVKRLTKAMVQPDFEVSASGNSLTLKNEFVTYQVTGVPIATEGKIALFAWDRLNAYRKAMVERKLPPHSQLAVTGELEKRRLFPAQMVLALSLPSGSASFTMRLEVLPLSAEERAKIKAAADKKGIKLGEASKAGGS